MYNKSDNSETSSVRQTRFRKILKKKIVKSESPDLDSDENENEGSSGSTVGTRPAYTVSSRGRVRKLTERARALLHKDWNLFLYFSFVLRIHFVMLYENHTF